jgi:TPR repeat protein
MRTSATVLIASLALAGPVFAAPQLPSVDLPMALERRPLEPKEQETGDTAFAAYQTGHYYAALEAALSRVEKAPDDTAAMTLLGELYRQGLGVPIDLKQAAEWYNAAALKGDAAAAFALALMKTEGRGTEKDLSGAAMLFEQAADKGNSQAEYNLGLLSLSGEGLDLDTAQAGQHFRKAAEAGDSDAQYAYATMLKDGRLGAPNLEASAQWLGKAAAQGNTIAEIEYAIALFNGNGVAKDEKEAARYLAQAAGKGNPIAQNRLARLYANGRGVPLDPVKAMGWHLLAQSAGRDDAWLDTFVQGLPQETQRLGYIQARQWQGMETLALDGSRPSGQTTGQPNSIAPEVTP